jgi:putative radical SAM enzyme (TIGR03279 family)
MMRRPTGSPGAVIKSIRKKSPAFRAGLRAGDQIIQISGHPVEDLLDVQFNFEEGDTELVVDQQGRIKQLTLSVPEGCNAGWTFEPLQVSTCHCKCTFCFVSQLPKGLRSSLYLKDEDYRFSFLYGNYLTLVGMRPADLERILRLRLSPLYISIHATDPKIRGQLLGIKNAPVLPQLQELLAGNIELHGQIVVAPGINDGQALIDSIEQLRKFAPALNSLAIVPVGLTSFRTKLQPLRLMTSDEAKLILKYIKVIQSQMLEKHGTRWIYPADELILLAKKPIPATRYYEQFVQIENGVGMARWTIDQARQALKEPTESTFTDRCILWVTGRSAYPVLSSLAAKIQAKLPHLTIKVLEVENQLLGKSVTVAGLLSGRDITDAIKGYLGNNNSMTFNSVYLSPDCINNDGVLIDDFTPLRIEKECKTPVRVFDGDWISMLTRQRVRKS